VRVPRCITNDCEHCHIAHRQIFTLGSGPDCDGRDENWRFADVKEFLLSERKKLKNE
jgi:hypothetical protein